MIDVVSIQKGQKMYLMQRHTIKQRTLYMTEKYIKDKLQNMHQSNLEKVKNMKNITFKNIPDELYYKVVEWKGRLRSDTWQDFLEKVIQLLEEHERR